MTDFIADILGTIGAATGIGAFIVGTRANRISREAKDDSAKALAIEAHTYRASITPRLEVTWLEPYGATHQNAVIEVKLVGPDGVDRLDAVEVFVRDDKPRTLDHPQLDGPTQVDINRHVWGPFRFDPGIDKVAGDGRRMPAFDLDRGATHRMQMDRTMRPWWDKTPPPGWEVQFDGHPVRLTFLLPHGGPGSVDGAGRCREGVGSDHQVVGDVAGQPAI